MPHFDFPFNNLAKYTDWEKERSERRNKRERETEKERDRDSEDQAETIV